MNARRKLGTYRNRIPVSAVPIIRKLVEEGASQSEIARIYGVTPAAINALVHRRTYRDID